MLKKYSAIHGYLVVRLFDIEMSLFRPIMDAQDVKESEEEVLDEEAIDSLAGALIYAKTVGRGT